MFFSKLYWLDLFKLSGLVNLTCMLEKHLMSIPPLYTHLVMQIWHEALPSVFVVWVSAAGRFDDLKLHRWTPEILIYKVWKSQLQNDSLERKINRSMVSDLSTFSQKLSKISAGKKFLLFIFSIHFHGHTTEFAWTHDKFARAQNGICIEKQRH